MAKVSLLTSPQTWERMKSSPATFRKPLKTWSAFLSEHLLYVRPTWREVQPRPGRLELPEYLKQVFDLAKKNNKRIGLRVQMSAPDYTHSPALPRLCARPRSQGRPRAQRQENQAAAKRYLKNPNGRYQPRFDDPFFQKAFAIWLAQWPRNSMAALRSNSSTRSCMASGAKATPGPSATIHFPTIRPPNAPGFSMLQVQLENFTKTPLLTNTQPDFSRVGNSEVLDRTVRSNNWIRSDTIFIENEQIEALEQSSTMDRGACSNRRCPANLQTAPRHEGVSPAENMIAHVMDVGANYWSLWNFHQIGARIWPTTIRRFRPPSTASIAASGIASALPLSGAIRIAATRG